MAETVAVVQSILECSSSEEIQNICSMCKIPATMVAIHSSILDKIQSDKTENSEQWSCKEEFNVYHHRLWAQVRRLILHGFESS